MNQQSCPTEITECPLGCKSGEEAVLQAPCDSPVSSGPDSYTVVKCKKCSVKFLNPRPSKEHLAEYYSRDYYGPDSRKFDEATERAVAFFVWWRGFILDKLVGRNSRILDIGCGRGNFLEVMKARGHEVFGTELNKLSAERASRLFGGNIFTKDIVELDLATSSFDMITLWHVIEHLPDPLLCLKKSYELLKPGGVIVLAQPNIDSIQAKIGGPLWFHLDIPRHLFHFSPKTLGTFLGSCGFRIERIRHHSVEQNPYGLLQTLLNVMGMRQNLLYKILKKEPGADITPFKRICLVTVYYALMPLAILITELGSLVGMGGTFYLVARKPLSSGL